MGQRSLKTLQGQLTEMGNYVHSQNVQVDSVSAACIGWHIEHALLVVDGVITALSESDPSSFRSSFNLKKTIIYLLGKFPKGKARAPKSVRPKTEVFSEEELTHHLTNTASRIPSLNQFDKKAHFKHPIFGFLALNDTIRFLEMHTEHHLKIIRDQRIRQE